MTEPSSIQPGSGENSSFRSRPFFGRRGTITCKVRLAFNQSSSVAFLDERTIVSNTQHPVLGDVYDSDTVCFRYRMLPFCIWSLLVIVRALLLPVGSPRGSAFIGFLSWFSWLLIPLSPLHLREIDYEKLSSHKVHTVMKMAE